MMVRVERQSSETRVTVQLCIADSNGPTEIVTPEPFLNHMLATLARYSGVGMSVWADGDLKHHVLEDVAITLGIALRDALPERCARYGNALIPMDDALVQCALDAGGRAWYEGPVPSRLYDHFFRSFAMNAALTLHLRVLRGRDRHHMVEAAFKALGVSLRTALRPADAVFSTKGEVRIVRQGGR